MSTPAAFAPRLELEGDVDHVNAEKLAFRRAALARDDRRTKMIELAAGVGYLTTEVYGDVYDDLALVEKDGPTFERLVRRVGRYADVRYFNKDATAFIAEDLPAHLDFSAVDADFFGVAGEVVAAFVAAVASKEEPFLLMATDGGLATFRRRGLINLRRYYLYGPDEVARVPEGWGDRFEVFQERFIARLAARYGFAADTVDLERNHNQTVLYSAYVLTPARP